MTAGRMLAGTCSYIGADINVGGTVPKQEPWANLLVAY